MYVLYITCNPPFLITFTFINSRSPPIHYMDLPIFTSHFVLLLIQQAITVVYFSSLQPFIVPANHLCVMTRFDVDTCYIPYSLDSSGNPVSYQHYPINLYLASKSVFEVIFRSMSYVPH